MLASNPTTQINKLPRLYKGAGPGTHWWTVYHANGGLPSGFQSPRPTTVVRINDIVTHITNYSANSPLTSVTTSFAVAMSYAQSGPAGAASATNPGLVFEIDLAQGQSNVRWFDPLAALSSQGVIHQHEGDQEFVSGLLRRPQPSLLPVAVAGGGLQLPVFTREFRAMMFAARDAELLFEAVDPPCIIRAHAVTV